MKKIKTGFLILLYVDIVLFLCSCTFYMSAVNRYAQNMEIKIAATKVLDFPEIAK